MNITSFAEWFRSILESAKFWFMVNPWEVAVRVRAGRWSKQIGPGTYFRIPFVDAVTTINVRLRITSTPSITITTMDGLTVTMALMIAFRISDPLLAMKALMMPEYTCAAMVQSAAAGSAAKLNANDLRGEKLIAMVVERLAEKALPGITFETIELTEMAIVRTIRLLQDNWKPMTSIAEDAKQF